jgi:hypothetical protein
MRRPCLASSPKRNRNRGLKSRSRKQTCWRPRRKLLPRLPIELPQAAPGAPQISAATEAPNSAAAEVAVCEPMRCGFGAVRVGALLGRLRLHLQTDRFLAVHRGDTMWERGCVGAALALAVMVAGMQEAELDAPLAPQRAQEQHALGTSASALPRDEPPGCSAGLQTGIAPANTSAALIPPPGGSGQGGGVTSVQAHRAADLAQVPQGRHKLARPGLQNTILPSECAFREGQGNAPQLSNACDASLKRGAR